MQVKDIRCHKLVFYINIAVLEKDIGLDQEAKEELLAKVGKTQVPCLFIDDETLHESDDIITWLKDNYSNQCPSENTYKSFLRFQIELQSVQRGLWLAGKIAYKRYFDNKEI